MNRIILGLVLAWALRASADPLLVYREALEQVQIQGVTFQYNPERKGFVSPTGDWVGWDDRAGNWLLRPKSGGQARFSASGDMIAMEKRKLPPAGGYNPAADLGDGSDKAKFDAKKAWDYLGDRQKTIDESAPAGAGDDGGPAVQMEAVGGDAVAREKAVRQEWAVRPGAHAGDPEAAMETGEVMDPIKKLMETMGQIKSTVQGVSSAIDEADSLQRQLDNFGEDNDVGYVPSSQGAAAGTTIIDDFGTGPNAAAGSGAPPATGGTGMPPPSSTGGATPQGGTAAGQANAQPPPGYTPYGGAPPNSSGNPSGSSYDPQAGQGDATE